MPIRPEMRPRYPADWALRSRFVRHYRARNRCEWCGAENHRPHPVTGARVVLTCAHVYDHRPEAAGLLNLAALCQRCHLRHDAPRRRPAWRHAERIKCPKCGTIQDASVQHTAPFWSYAHECPCGYWITESEWETVPNAPAHLPPASGGKVPPVVGISELGDK